MAINVSLPSVKGSAPASHATLVIVNDCSSPQSDVEKMQEICRMDKAWVKYLTWISGLRSFTLHTARCPFRDTPFEGRDDCPDALPLAAEVLDTFSKNRRGTEDRKYDLVLKDGDRYKLPKTPMARHLLRHHFNPFYFGPFGAVSLTGSKKQYALTLVFSPWHICLDQRHLERLDY